MVSKAFLKTATTLDTAKGRRKAGLFVAEGTKCVLDLSRRFEIVRLLALPEWLAEYRNVIAAEITECSRAELKEASRLQTVPPVIAYFRLPEQSPTPTTDYVNANAVLVLDTIQDPGNLGTILRTCDWMGITEVVASRETVDAFNPKVVQATMGALTRVNVSYTDLAPWLKSLPKNTPIYGTFLDSTDAYTEAFPSGCVIIMGNEGNGISDTVAACVSHRITIPAAPNANAESLNVATATAIILALRFRGLTEL